MEKSKQSEAAARWRQEHRPGRPSKIMADPELRAYIDERLPIMTFEQIAKACHRQFGAARAVSQSTIGHYWLTLAKPVMGLADPISAPRMRRPRKRARKA